jgi:uncharacterized protein (TIGR02246 family)
MSGVEAHDDGDEGIQRVEREYDAAWNRGDVAGLVSLYQVHAVVVNPLGEIARGHAAIRAALEGFLGGAARGSRHTTRITDIARVGSSVAIVDGEARLDGLNGGESEPILHRYTDVVVKTDTGWVIAHTRGYVFAEPRRVTG